MNKPLLLAAVLLAAPLALRADDEEAPGSGPDAAASSTKGYRTDEAPQAATTGGDSAPIETRSDPRVLSVPSQRPLGGEKGAARPASPGTGSGGASGAGISCENSVPKLKNVIKKKFDFSAAAAGPVNDWDLGPNEAISYVFKTPASGTAKIFITMGHIGRPVPHLATVSRTPCDFDVEKARKAAAGDSGPNSCYAWGPSEGGLVFAMAPSKLKGCVLKPNTEYYFNIRSLSNPGQGARDACADELPFFRSRPDLPRLCGGIWQLRAYGN